MYYLNFEGSCFLWPGVNTKFVCVTNNLLYSALRWWDNNYEDISNFMPPPSLGATAAPHHCGHGKMSWKIHSWKSLWHRLEQPTTEKRKKLTKNNIMYVYIIWINKVIFYFLKMHVRRGKTNIHSCKHIPVGRATSMRRIPFTVKLLFRTVAHWHCYIKLETRATVLSNWVCLFSYVPLLSAIRKDYEKKKI